MVSGALAAVEALHDRQNRLEVRVPRIKALVGKIDVHPVTSQLVQDFGYIAWVSTDTSCFCDDDTVERTRKTLYIFQQ